MQGHETSKCWLDIPPAHSDRNIETIAFELSTKGKQWALNPKGPYCPAKWYLNGKPRVVPAKPATTGQQHHSKLFATMLTTILDKVKLNKTNHCD